MDRRGLRAIDYIPSGVQLTAYGGDAAELPAGVLQAHIDDVAAGRLLVPIHRTYALDEIAQAHADMEHGGAADVKLDRWPTGASFVAAVAPSSRTR